MPLVINHSLVWPQWRQGTGIHRIHDCDRPPLKTVLVQMHATLMNYL